MADIKLQVAYCEKVAALGRPFTLGMFYDARKEELIPGVTLWDEKDLQKMTKNEDQHSSNTQITTFDSLEEKSSLLDMNASLKASFLGGLVTVEGSAKYLNDRKQSLKQSRVTFQYNATTIFQQLMFSADNLEKAKKLSDDIKGLATHIVTGILYGAKAFFVFDSQTSDGSSVEEVEGSMKAVINKIPAFKVDGKVDIKLTENEKALCDKMTCKFYGDFLLESNPVTFKDAVKAYSDLPKLLKDKQEAGVPLKVWMMPLKSLFPSAAVMMPEISPDTIRKVHDALEDLHELKIRCNKCPQDGYHFPAILEKLNNFKKSCEKKIATLQDLLAKNIISIRKGKIKEEVLLKLFDNKDESLFNTEELKDWMGNLEREVTVIRICEEMMKPAKIIQSAAELDAEILDPEVEEIICFVFTSLESKDSRVPKPKTKAPWYYSDELIAKAKAKARMLGDLARPLKNSSRYRCRVTAINDPEHEGATMYHYGNSKCLSKDFKKPTVGVVEKITERKELIWYATELTLDPDTAYPSILLAKEKKATCEEQPHFYPDLPQRFDSFTQVLCREKLSGRHYWEVEWSLDQSSQVRAAVCYGSIERKGNGEPFFGYNDKSWSFGYQGKVHASFVTNHNNTRSVIPVPHTGCPRVGIFLDWEKGSLSYYIVTGDQLSHIHSFYAKFSEPLYPGFWIGVYSNFHLCF